MAKEWADTFYVQRNLGASPDLVALFSTALSEAYAAGRAAGVEEAAKVAERVADANLSNDFEATDESSIAQSICNMVRSLLPTPVEDATK